MKNKSFWISILAACTLFPLIALSSFLFPTNLIQTMDSKESGAIITDFQRLNSGIVQDESDDGKQILSISRSGAQRDLWGLDLYSVEDNSLVNIATSPTEIGSAVLTKKGIYYTKKNDTNSYADNLYQLMWYSLDKSEVNTITDGDKSCTGVFTAWGDSGLAYVLGGNEIIFTDSSLNEWRYQFDKSLTIKKIRFNAERKQAYVLTDENMRSYTSLYILDLKSNGRVSRDKLENNIIDFDFSETSQSLVFIQQTSSTVQMYACSTKERISRPLLQQTGNFQSVSFTKDGSYLLYTNNASSKSDANVSIWITPLSFSYFVQISAPMTLSSSITSRSVNQPVYFSSSDEFLEVGLVNPMDSSLICILKYTLRS